jgi:hypothetical protein
MSTSDMISFASLVFSGLAFFVAMLTFVYSVATGPRLRMLIGGDLWLFYSSDNKLVIETDCAFFNSGAQPGALLEFSGTLTSSDGSKVPLHCTGLGGGRGVAAWHTPAGSPQPLIIPGRGVSGAETQRLFLITNVPFELADPFF